VIGAGFVRGEMSPMGLSRQRLFSRFTLSRVANPADAPAGIADIAQTRLREFSRWNRHEAAPVQKAV